MHIEPGLLAQGKLMFANVAAVAVLAAHAPALLRRPALWLRTAIAALFFSVLMQSFHMPVGPSELHLIGAMPMYLLLGFLPTMFGFVAGLLLQGLVFEPQDLMHLAVNALSLIVPLMVVHHTLGRAADGSLRRIVRLDAVYYAGVTLMVGFWLALGEQATALSDWAVFAASYLSVAALEPVFTFALVRGVATVRDQAWARACLDERLTASA
ncbi:energy-coupling factor ABC transporter permease [Azohydromonas caseinilytica]|uniref:Energy-coupling factor ABC transporter permease n=1 Tax=Azohydromonas caseinilytica TaxID=2728836 RepID=A0A848FCW2_9BURK|nr:energy-coupling factor ABC transporter permease [Azohydromonas caseinilytica]NML16000.1 energy-coupling factor ABC transporter permease [Azohydromonas caseinilytica]